MGFNLVGHGVVWRGNSFRGDGSYGNLSSQSMEGDGYFGSLSGQSFQGGGSMSSVTISYCGGGGNGFSAPQSRISLFVKIPSAPSGDTVLYDCDFGAAGFSRLKLTSALHLVYEVTINGDARTVDVNAGSSITLNSWWWVSCGYHVTNNGPNFLAAQCWSPGGITVGEQYSTGITQYGHIGFTRSGVFGLGKHTSSSYADFSTISGGQISKCLIHNANIAEFDAGSLISPPSIDWTSFDSNYIAYWNCRDGIGTHSTLLDATSNHIDLSGAFTIVIDGPYP